MKRSIASVAVASILACLCGTAADARVYLGRVDGTVTQPAAASQIELTQVFVVLVPIQQFANIGEPVECAFFVNHGPKEVRRVRVRWSYTALDGANAGTTVGFDTKDIGGTFSANVPIEDWPQYGRGVSQECQKFGGTIQDKKLIYWSKTNGAVSLQAQVESVDFADGTSWQAPPQTTPSPSPSP